MAKNATLDFAPTEKSLKLLLQDVRL